jgi:putative transcriptional regulator
MSIRLNIEVLINNKNMSMYKLAKDIGVTYPTVLNLVKGHPNSIRLETIEGLCKALECDPSNLFIIEE